MSTKTRRTAWTASLTLVMTVLLCVPASVHADPDRAREYKLKAAFLFNFTRFVEWSSARTPANQKDFELCVVADAFVSGQIGQVVGERLQLKRISDEGRVQSCHLVFVAESERANLAAFAHAAQRSNALLVSEASDFGEAIGMINLVVVKNRIRVEVDLEAVEDARLRISSRLLSLATLRKSGTR